MHAVLFVLRKGGKPDAGGRILRHTAVMAILQARTHPLPFLVTTEMPCPYLPGKVERKVVTELSGPAAAENYEILSRAGFRRSHSIAYRPACPGCSACVAVRVVVR